MRIAASLSCALIASSCVWSGEQDDNPGEKLITDSIGTDHPCEFLYTDAVEQQFFGGTQGEQPTETVEDDYLRCDKYIITEHNSDDTGELYFVSGVFSNANTDGHPTGDMLTPKDEIGWFSPESRSDANEVIDSSITPLDNGWDDGEMYLFDGLDLEGDLYIVGAWGRIGDLYFGVNFRVAAPADYFDQPLTYHKYCDATDLESDCLISSDVLYEWMNSEYLPAILERLETASEK